jgi:hypothetical protein
MDQLWTIIFAALLAIGFSFAAWQDRSAAKRREQRNIAPQKGDRIED